MKYLPDAIAGGALLCVGAGCWLVSPALGLIVPGLLVFGSIAVSRLRG